MTYVDIGGIRAFVARPEGDAPVPAILFYSDIFQLTPPHLRLARRFADLGYLVLAAELYGRFEPAGTVLEFERDRQRALDDSARVRVEDVDADRAALLAYLAGRADVTRIFAAGWCFGGHLAFRAAYEPAVAAVACCYATTIHTAKLGASDPVDTLSRAAALRAPLLLVWGTRDPHIPEDGRATIHAALDVAGARYEPLLFDAEHAFMRDEGPRYDAAATDAAVDAIDAWFTAAG